MLKRNETYKMMVSCKTFYASYLLKKKNECTQCTDDEKKGINQTLPRRLTLEASEEIGPNAFVVQKAPLCRRNLFCKATWRCR